MFSNHTQLNPESVNYVNKILDLERYNGRVNIIQPPNPDIQFQMAEKISIANRATDYRESLTGNFEDNVLAQVFFCKENLQIIQNGLRAGVHEMSNEKYIIPNQNINNLKIIMRSTYLQYAEHYATDITKQVERLNKIVLDYCIPSVYNEAVGYERYCQDQSSLVVPLVLPQHHDREYKQLELKPWV